jgi:uncharacterized damage-inducible protein DinB
MTITPDLARLHFAYTRWATSRLLDSARGLSPEELVRDFGTADRSVLGTLTHVFAADRVWLARLDAEPPEAPEGYDLERLAGEWSALLGRWQERAAGFTESSLAERISYRDLKGNPWITPVWQIVLHVVNHGTHHRGQVAGFLRTMGKVPPTLDLIAFYRQADGPAARPPDA